MQKLILPLNNVKVTANYRNAAYLAFYGYAHYGIDYVGDNPTIYGSGDGEVLIVGYDNRLGNTVIVKYPGCLIHKTGEVKDLIARYCHLSSISVKAGQSITKDTIIGISGQTPIGKINGVHLHLEFDTDTNYPQYSPTISSNSNIIKAGTRGEGDTTINPSWVLHIKDTEPDDQSIRRKDSNWTAEEDVDLPLFDEVQEEKDKVIQLVNLYTKTEAEQIVAKLEGMGYQATVK